MARRQVSIFINGAEVKNTLRAITKEKNKLNRELANSVEGTKEYEKAALGLKKITPILEKQRQKQRELNKSYSSLTSGLTKYAGIAAAAFGVGEIIQYGKKLFSLSVEMETLSNKAAIVFGQALPEVTRAAEENAAAMGFTTSQYTDAATAIGDILIPMGFQREEAAGLSTGLIDLSGALAEWSGGQKTSEEVSRSLSKALTGEREELKQLGIVIQEADVKARLQEKGLSKLTGTMLQQAKAVATYELILEKSVDAQTSFAEGSDTLIRRQAKLEATIGSLQEKLATLLLPVMERLFAAAEVGVELIGYLAEQFDGLGASSKRMVDDLFEQEQGFKKLEGEVSPLLDRYDELQRKTTLTADEQAELATIIQRVANLTPAAITEIDNYGNALSISTDESRAFLEAERARLEFVNKDAIEGIKENIAALEEQRKFAKDAAARGAGGAFSIAFDSSTIKSYQDQVAGLTREIQGATAELSRLEGGFLADSNRQSTGDQKREEELARRQAAADAALADEAEAAEAAKRREASFKKELKERERNLGRLAEVIDKFQNEQNLAALDEDERELEQIRQKYDQQIALASELERQGIKQATAQRLELEALRDQELDAAKEARNAERRERELEEEERIFIEDAERARANEERRQELQAEIDAQVREVVLSSRELAIIELEEHYDQLVAQAKLFEIDTLELEVARRKELAAINEDFDTKDLQQAEQAQKARIASAQASYQALQGLVSTALNDVLTDQERATGAGKILALINIGIAGAEALAKATAASAGVPFPGNLAAIAASASSVLGIIGQARQALNSTPSVRQRKEGGYAQVQGEDDGRTYQARRIGSPKSGMLSGGPVLIDSVIGQPILANERGNEYFVNHEDLRKPAVFQHVQAIERVRQRMSGGFADAETSTSLAPAGAPNQDQGEATNATNVQLVAAIQGLVSVLNRGIFAVIDDDSALDLRNRLAELDRASGLGG